MGKLKPDEKHRVVIEVHGKKLKDITEYMNKLRQLLKSYGATIKERRKLKHRRVARRPRSTKRRRV